MTDKIKVLPDAVANQIAAGEVIQRPASIIKELVENSIDAGSTDVTVVVKDAGRTLVQVSDNGSGMSETDARLAFERHATSKITSAEDLFMIRTMGFRGEALASIAAVAQVELKTRRAEDELGTLIEINGSVVERQENVNCQVGTTFLIKNLFYNIPARRKFLKENPIEFKHIVTEFQKIVLTYPEIAFQLLHNGNLIYQLPVSNLRQRIVNIFGKNINPNLIPLHVDTTLVKLSGFVGSPEYAKKKNNDQYFFVNKRFMKHPYFHKAVLLAYDQILPHDQQPAYFIYLDVDPASIDINIHPTKTEIKFEDGEAIFQIIRSAVREALGKVNAGPSIDFDREDDITIPMPSNFSQVKMPSFTGESFYNPFEKSTSSQNDEDEELLQSRRFEQETEAASQWSMPFSGISHPKTSVPSFKQATGHHEQRRFEGMGKTAAENIPKMVLQLKNKYLLTSVKSGLMLIDQSRAHERILYESLMNRLDKNLGVAQIELFPTRIELPPSEAGLLKELMPDLKTCGFDITLIGENSFSVNSSPSELEEESPADFVVLMIETYKNSIFDPKTEIKERVARAMAKASSIGYGKQMKEDEMQQFIDRLFACSLPNYSPDGKLAISILSMEDIEKKFS